MREKQSTKRPSTLPPQAGTARRGGALARRQAVRRAHRVNQGASMSTSDLLLLAGLIVAAYLVGSIPFSYLVARARGVDLRKVGSGNIGGANVWRACGFGPFVVAAALDILKGYLPTLAGLRLFSAQPVVVLLVGIAAILGHTFPIFL